MTKQELAKDISERTGVEKIVAVKTIEAFMQTVRNSMINGQDVFLRGFGTFHVKKRAKKLGRNITKNTSVVIPEHFAPAFKPSKEFINMIKLKKHKVK